MFNSVVAITAETPGRSRPNPIDVLSIVAGSHTSGEGTESQSSTRGVIGMVKPTGITPTIVYFSPSYSSAAPSTSGLPPYAICHQWWLIIAT